MDTLLQQISNTNISIERLRAARDQGDQNHKEIEKLLEKKCELEQLEARLREEMKCAAELEQARHREEMKCHAAELEQARHREELSLELARVRAEEAAKWMRIAEDLKRRAEDRVSEDRRLAQQQLKAFHGFLGEYAALTAPALRYDYGKNKMLILQRSPLSLQVRHQHRKSPLSAARKGTPPSRTSFKASLRASVRGARR